MSSDELKPCPFCGGAASYRLYYGGRYRVHCNECGCHLEGLFDTEAEAGAAWNNRPKRVMEELVIRIIPRVDFDKTADEFEKAAEKLREAVEHEEDE